MRVRVLSAATAALLLAGAALLAQHAGSTATKPPASSYVRGVGLGLFATDPDWDYGAMIEEIRARGATDVLVVVNGFQSDRFASDVALRPGHSPSLPTVARTLRQVRAAGMRAALMPVVRLQRRGPGDWRGVITPADGVGAWFASYRRFVLPLARIAADAGAGRLVIGSELNSLEPEAERWRALASELRRVYPGTLGYSANWDRGHAVPFWDAVDEVGLTAYFPLTAGDAPSALELAAAWRAPRARIDALARRAGKPVVITEVGYPSQRGAHHHPWDDTRKAEIDLDLQQRLYHGFCDAVSQSDGVGGFYVWNWFGYGGPRDAGFSPRGKPAAAALSECFARPLERAPVHKPEGSRS